jgi:hypothetical protein
MFKVSSVWIDEAAISSALPTTVSRELSQGDKRGAIPVCFKSDFTNLGKWAISHHRQPRYATKRHSVLHATRMTVVIIMTDIEIRRCPESHFCIIVISAFHDNVQLRVVTPESVHSALFQPVTALLHPLPGCGSADSRAQKS